MENKLANMNKILLPGSETLFLNTEPAYQCIASSLVRDVIKNKGNWEAFVPVEVVPLIQKMTKA